MDCYRRDIKNRVKLAEWFVEGYDHAAVLLWMDPSIFGKDRHHAGSRYWLVGPDSVLWEGDSLALATAKGDEFAKGLASPKEFTMDGKVLECGRNKYIYGGGKWPVPKTWPDGTKVEITVRRVE